MKAYLIGTEWGGKIAKITTFLPDFIFPAYISYMSQGFPCKHLRRQEFSEPNLSTQYSNKATHRLKRIP